MKKIVLGALVSLTLCPHAAFSADDTVTIGFPIALSGFVAPYDDGPHKAALLAIDDINAKGGLLGKKIVAVEADTKSDPGQGATAATDVLGKGAVMTMVTCDFDFGGPAALVAQSHDVLAFSPCAADPKFGVQGIGPDAYTLSTAVNAQGALIAEWAYKTAGYRRPYMLKDTMLEYTKTLCDSFEERWNELAGADAIVGRDTYHGVNDTSIAGQITRLKANDKKPDFVMFCGGINGGSAVRQIRAAGVSLPMICGDSMDGDYWLNGVPNLSDFYVATYASVFGNDPDQKINDFVRRFKEKFGAAPVTSHALTGYAVIEAWAVAVTRSKTFDTDKVRAELDKFSKEPLLVGATSFTPDLHINLNRPELLMRITNGKHEPVGRFALEKPPSLKF
jgi:branched-chain amino acid transport system substrate-binding protein